MATTDAAARVRAVARVGAQPLPDPERAILRPRHRPGHLGPVSALQIVALEAAVVLGLLAWRQPSWALPLELGVAGLLPAVVFARYRGRWWTERLVVGHRYRQRRSTARLLGDDRRLTALRELVPDLTVETVAGAGGAPLGVGRDGAGWFATVAVTPADHLRGEAQPLPPIDLLARTVAEADQPGSVVQVVVHTRPAPASVVGAEQPCVQSYRELIQPAAPGPGGAASSVLEQVCWVSVRIEARAMAELAVEAPESLGEVPAVLAALVRRVGNVLKRAGFSYRVLDTAGLLDALVHSLAVDVTAPGAERRAAAEHWRGWRSGRLDHRCQWVRNWPSLAECPPLLTELYQSPAALTSLSLTLWPGKDGTEFRCLTRIADPPHTIGAAVAAARTIARRRRARLFPLDGEQAPAVYATAPTGGGAL